MTTTVDTLADALPREQARVRALMRDYRSIGAPGRFALAMMEMSLTAAEKAASAGDVVAMLRAYEDLKTFES